MHSFPTRKPVETITLQARSDFLGKGIAGILLAFVHAWGNFTAQSVAFDELW